MSDICVVHDREYRVESGRRGCIPGLHCSWDGSLHPDVFMELVESGRARLTPTDKNYKVYIEIDDVDDGAAELRVVSAITFEPRPDERERWTKVGRRERKILKASGWGGSDYKYVQLVPVGRHRHDKFYFEHLSEEQKRRFIDLLNAKSLRIEFPGHFYRLPFFISAGAA